MTTDPVFAAWTKRNATNLSTPYGARLTLPSGSDTFDLFVAGDATTRFSVGTITGQTVVSLGDGTHGVSALFSVTGTAEVTLTGVLKATSAVLTTPTLGVASATTINKVTITAPATGATLTIADGKTHVVNNSITLTGTDSTTMTFPSTSATIARTDAANTFTGHQTIEGVTSTGATGTGKFAFSDSPSFTTQWDVQDGTSAHGQSRSAVNAFGAGVGIYAAPGDAQVQAGLQGGAASAAWTLGPGGSTAPDVKVVRSGTGTATVTGALTMTSAVLITPTIGVATGTSLALSGGIGFNGKTVQSLTGIAAPTATALRTAAPNATYSTTGGTGATAGAFDTAAHRDNVITDLANTMQRLGALITDLRANGVIG